MADTSYILCCVLDDADSDHIKLGITPCPDQDDLCHVLRGLLDEGVRTVIITQEDLSTEKSQELLEATKQLIAGLRGQN